MHFFYQMLLIVSKGVLHRLGLQRDAYWIGLEGDFSTRTDLNWINGEPVTSFNWGESNRLKFYPTLSCSHWNAASI